MECYDLYAPNIRVAGNHCLQNGVYSTELLQTANCVVIMTNHSNCNWQEVLDNSVVVVDTSNALSGYETDTPIITL